MSGWGEMPEYPSKDMKIARLEALCDEQSQIIVRLQAHVSVHCSLDSATCCAALPAGGAR